MNKLLIFDFDSTLIDGETIDFFASELNISNKVSKITDLAMAGEIDFFESLIERVKLLKGLKKSTVLNLINKIPLMEGAEDVVSEFKRRGYKILCFSGGFRDITKPISKKLGIDADFANILHYKDNILTGQVGGEMMFNSSKGDMLQRIQKILDISIENSMVVGDGANDLSMFKYAKTKVAFCAKPILKESASHIIDKKDLREIYKIIK